jgi:hypothetical protein
METLTVAAVPTCDNKEDEPLRKKEPYRLLQEAKRTRIIVQQCIAESAQYIYHCSPTSGGGSTVFVSTDKYMLRLKVVGRPISRCGAIVYQTNYPNFVLTKDMDHPLFQRKLHVSEFSILSYVIMQDEFVNHELMDSVEEVAERFRQERCQSKAVEKNTALARRAAEQGAVVDGQTAHLGAWQLITASREVWYSYHCRKVLVQAVAQPGGSRYTALPVQLSD